MTSTIMRVALVLSAFALALSFAVPSFATTYYGPSLQTPVSIAPGSSINIVLTTTSSSTFTAPPAGSVLCASVVSGNTQTCAFPLQACTNPTPGSGFYYSVHEITVTDPNGNSYMLGSATTSGLYWPASLGGSGSGTHVPPQADALNVTIGDSFTVPFKAGAGGFSFTSVLSNPPNDVTPAGPYYWWTVAGNTFGSNLRLDLNPSINPTLTHGSYTVDIEGVVVCGNSVTQTVVQLFFDAGIVVTTPQFGIALGTSLAVAAGMIGLVLMKKKALRVPLPS